MTATATCPRCFGFPELDEAGHPYTCYVCCDTGSVSADLAESIQREEADYAEKFTPARLGVFARSPAEFDEDELGAPAPGSRLFTRFIRIPRAPIVTSWDTDIPF